MSDAEGAVPRGNGGPLPLVNALQELERMMKSLYVTG